MITDEQRKAFEQWYMAKFGDKDMQTTESGDYFYVRHAEHGNHGKQLSKSSRWSLSRYRKT